MKFEGYCQSSLWNVGQPIKEMNQRLITAWDYARHTLTGACRTWSNEEEMRDPLYGCLRGTVMERSSLVHGVCSKRPPYGAKTKR